ncbi:MAG: hypothetical protein Q8O67_30185 [Deltaproteobacteria bacterium]|nr:hypothetical protein [Deltaproteobacteria bacterium]
MVDDDDTSWQLPPAEFDALRAALGHVRGGLVAADNDRVEHLAPLIAWLNDGAPLAVPADAPVAGQAVRLWALTQHLGRYHDDAKSLGDLIGAVLVRASALPFFARTGLPGEARLFSEIFDRVARKILPTPADDSDLSVVLHRGLDSRRFLREAAGVVVVDLFALLVVHSPALEEGIEKIERDIKDAVSVLAVRVAHLGVAFDMRARAGAADGELADYPFLDLPRWCDLVLERRHSDDQLRDRITGARNCLRRCHGVLRKIHGTLVTGSVSVDLVFRLDVADRQVSRLERLLQLVDPGADRAALAVQTVKELLDQGESDTSLRGLFADNTRLLARRIVEATGTTGEHYIASSSSEYRAMWRSAAAGGAFMALVVPAKYLLMGLELAPFFSGFAAALLYGAAFVLMQAWHMTLATKQPSMTAATLAAALDEHGRTGVHRLVDLITRTARTQLAAVIGNIGVVAIGIIALHFVILAVRGKPFFNLHDAEHALEVHHLWQSGSVFFAALTGVYLWSSSVAGGWCDNWVRYRRLPEALATNRRIRRVIGVSAAEKLAGVVDKHGAGVFGALFFGLVLGLTPVVGGFFGLPLDIRHITLSTGAVVLGALSAFSVGHLETAALGGALLGLAGIATMNFTVSFSLALAVALRARDIDARVFRLLVAAVLGRLVRRPMEFVLPRWLKTSEPPTSTTP